MEGLLLVDKPKGPTSFHVVKKVRALTGVKKVGHAGTLDPEAFGLLLVCVGRYTKLSNLLMNGDKEYHAVFRLGERTASDDAETEVIERQEVGHLTIADIERACETLRGKIKQIPPQFSAVKVNGQRAYALARKATLVDLLPRSVEIFVLTLDSYNAPDLFVRIRCSKGVYVRALARDLGSTLGVGAHARNIRRTVIGNYKIEDAINLDELSKDNISGHLLKGHEAFSAGETIELSESEKDNIINGRRLSKDFAIMGAHALAFYRGSPIVLLNKSVDGVKIARVL